MPKLWYDSRAKQYATKITRDGVSRKFYFGRDKKQAEKDYHQLMADYKSGKLKLFSSQGITIEVLAEDYLAYTQKNRSEATYRHYRHFVSKFVKQHLGELADNIKALDLEKYKQALQSQNLSPATVNHAIVAVKIMYNWAVSFDLLEKHDLGKVKKLPDPPSRLRFLSEGEITRLLRSCDGDMRKMITIFIETGMRLGELTTLRFRDVDFKRKQITIYRHKTSRTARQPKPRVIPLTKAALKALRERRDETKQNVTDDLQDMSVFPNRKGGEYNKDTLRRRFDRVKKKAKLDDITIHTLRHTFGSRAVMSGIDLKTVAELMGHTSTRTTEIYAHLSGDHLRSAIKKLENHKGY